MENINEYIKKWSEKLSIPVEEIESEYKKLVEQEKLIHTNLDEDKRNQRALQRLALMYKKQLRSPAVGFEGVIIGTSDAIDVVAKRRREATELFRADPGLAVANGVTDEEGIPLDTKETWASGKANPSYGKPLPETSFISNVYGMARKPGEEAFKFFSMTLNGLKAQAEDMPVFKPIKFMAINKSKDGDSVLALNPSTFTTFNIDEKLVLPAYKDLLGQSCSDKISELKNLEDYHNKTKDNFGRIIIVEGDISSLNLEPTAFGSRIMNLEDPEASLKDLGAKSTSCWIPSRTDIDFAEGSKVIVVGRTAQGFKKDETGNKTSELGDVSINIFGIYALPEFKVELPEEIKPITEDII